MGDHVGRADATRERMLAAGRELLSDVATVDDVTVRQICRAAGGSPSSFYRIFESRDRFLLLLHSQLVAELVDAATYSIAEPTPVGESGEVWLRRAVAALLDQVEKRLWFVAQFAPLVRRDREHASLKTRLDTGIVDQFDDSIARRFDDGSADLRVRSRVVAWTLWASSVRGHTGRVPFLGSTDASPDERAAAAERLSLMALGYLRRPMERVALDQIRIPQLPDRPPGEGLRDRVLDAMEQLLDGRDAMELTTLDVAIAADLAQGSIYDEFGTKVDVIAAVLDRMLSEISDTADRELTAGTSEALDRPADLVLFMAQAYSILVAFMDQRFHLLGAFEVPARIAPEVADALVTNEERLIARAAELLPQWVIEEGDVASGIFAGRACKLVLQAAFWGDPPFGDSLGLSKEELVAELAVMSAGVITPSPNVS